MIVLETSMMKALVALVLFMLATASLAASPACMRDCARQGYDYGYCSGMCDRGQPDIGLPQQQGAPGNPYLDSIPDPVPKRQAVPNNVDPRCFGDCRARGYEYGYCRNYCRY